MPLQRSYDVTCVEGGDAPEPAPPTSHIPWILRLITFFILCIIVLLLCLFLWPKPTQESHAGAESQHGNPTEDVPGVVQSQSSGVREPYIDDATDRPRTATTTESVETKTGKKKEAISTAKPTETPTTTPALTKGKTTEEIISSADEHTKASKSTSTTVKYREKLIVPDLGDTESTTPTITTVENTENSKIATTEPAINERVDTIQRRTSTTHDSPETSTTTSRKVEAKEETTVSSDDSADAASATSTTMGTNGETTIVSDHYAETSSTTSPTVGTNEETPIASDHYAETSLTTFTTMGTNEETTIASDHYVETSSTTSTTVGTNEETPTASDHYAETSSTTSTTVGTNEETTIATDHYAETPSTTSTTVRTHEETTISTNTSTETSATTSTTVIVTNQTTISTDKPNERTTTTPTTTQRAHFARLLETEDNTQFGSQTASRMLFYMNHSADACQDFYEYACGGFEAERLMAETDLAEQAIKRIFDQASKVSSSGQHQQFLDYYKSCISYNKDSPKSEKLQLVKEAIAEVGKFYSDAEWDDDYLNLTNILSQLFLRNSAPVFDITPDVAVQVQESCTDPADPAKFTLKLGPSMLENDFYENQKAYNCYNELKSKMLEQRVDLNSLYEAYITCKNNLTGLIESAKEVLRQVSPLNHEEIFETTFTIEKDLRPAFPWLYSLGPRKYINNAEVRKAFMIKEYAPKEIGDLQNGLDDTTFLNWAQLLQTLGNSATEFQQTLQVYFFHEILEGLNALIDTQGKALHNAFIALYAHKMYYEFVEPPRDVENYCKRTAIRLMPTHASNLYMSSFTPKEHEDIHATITLIFEELKRTLESGIKKTSWLKNIGDVEIVKKIQDLQIVIPDSLHFQDIHSVKTPGSEIETKLTGAFFNDTLKLEKQNRESMYKMLGKSPSDQKQIWTYFGRPYDITGSAIHGLNKIIVPYGIVDWPAIWSAEKISARHLILATLGTRIGSLIARHFDTTGIQYLAGMKNTEKSAVFCSDELSADESYKEYIEEHKTHNDVTGTNDNRYIDIPFTGQNVQYKITELGQLEILPLKMGLQLAYNTMLSLPQNAKKLVPWLTNDHDVLVNENEKKQFFLAHAQMQCTRVPLTSTFVSLYEDGNLPSRLRVLETASSIETVGNTWVCPVGARVFPENIPSAFPNLEIDEGSQQVEELL